MSAAQLISALPGAIIGIPAGLYLYRVAAQQQALTIPPVWELAVILFGTLLAVAVLTVVPLRLAERQTVAEVLQSERTGHR